MNNPTTKGNSEKKKEKRIYIPGIYISPSKTGLIVFVHRLTNITLLTLVQATLSVVSRGVADLYP